MHRSKPWSLKLGVIFLATTFLLATGDASSSPSVVSEEGKNTWTELLWREADPARPDDSKTSKNPEEARLSLLQGGAGERPESSDAPIGGQQIASQTRLSRRSSEEILPAASDQDSIAASDLITEDNRDGAAALAVQADPVAAVDLNTESDRSDAADHDAQTHPIAPVDLNTEADRNGAPDKVAEADPIAAVDLNTEADAIAAVDLTNESDRNGAADNAAEANTIAAVDLTNESDRNGAAENVAEAKRAVDLDSEDDGKGPANLIVAVDLNTEADRDVAADNIADGDSIRAVDVNSEAGRNGATDNVAEADPIAAVELSTETDRHGAVDNVSEADLIAAVNLINEANRKDATNNDAEANPVAASDLITIADRSAAAGSDAIADSIPAVDRNGAAELVPLADPIPASDPIAAADPISEADRNGAAELVPQADPIPASDPIAAADPISEADRNGAAENQAIADSIAADDLINRDGTTDGVAEADSNAAVDALTEVENKRAADLDLAAYDVALASGEIFPSFDPLETGHYKTIDDVAHLAIVFVNTARIELAKNWACMVRNLGLTEHVFIAMDDGAFEALEAFRLPVLRAPTVERLNEIATRAGVVRDLLKKGASLLLVDPAAVWLEDPWKHVMGNIVNDADVLQQDTVFVFLKSSDAMTDLWGQVFREFTRNSSPDDNSAYPEWQQFQKLVSQSPDLVTKNFPQILFPSGQSFFSNLKNYIGGHPWPAAIGFEDGQEPAAQEAKLKRYGLWYLRDKTCETIASHQAPYGEPAAITQTAQTPRMIIKVLTYDRPDSLARLLRSLSAASYGTAVIDVDIIVDFPRDNSSISRLVRQSVLQVADNWVWTHGRKRVRSRAVNVGLAMQWYEIWHPASDDEVAFVVEDDLELSPLWYTWMEKALRTYYWDVEPSERDPRMYGISLQNQGTCMSGCTVSVSNGHKPFRYQLVGTWGQLLFPRPWLHFTDWIDVKSTMDYKPLFSNLKSNKWFTGASDKGKAWTFHFIAFVAEMGYYNVYTNFEDKRSLSVCHREAGVHYGKTQGQDRQMLGHKEWKAEYLDLPALEELLLFDYHFNSVEAPGTLGHRRFGLLEYPKDWKETEW
ncbi:hypothetical protein BDK51DRAFT_27876 [Blyttiomyces helicus]|uniref:Uncharacterized protein n=1 Tax=Blyttiomyces helicus TaxID=388810 RepID=A0A4P9WDM8_9FUNG|nr:hypothetical protein BDK51DRAFT_27876 [Blyttiomyces helicus]|eukprot:RKO89338.1 hypothetical protein BDK51DRAFT_27876 [Blyttiomyces helicus]